MVAARYIFLSLLAFLLVACGQQSKEELLQAGLGQLATGNARGSIVYFKNALEKDPSYFPARFHLADAYLKTGKLLKAEKELKKASRQKPQYPDLSVKFAEIYNLTNRSTKSVEILTDYFKDNPTTADGLDLLGRAYGLSGNFKDAEIAFLQALSLKPADEKIMVHLAGTYRKSEKTDRARHLLEDVIEKSPQFGPAWAMLGDLEIRSGNSARALDVYRQYAAAMPADASSLFRLGLLELQENGIDRVNAIVEELKRRFPRNSSTGLLSGLVLFREKRYSDASLEFDRSLKKRINPLGVYFLGLCAFQKGQLEQAVNQFQRVLDLVPKSSQARVLLAMTFLRQNRLDDALVQAKSALHDFPENAWAYNVLSSVLIAQGKYEEGLNALDEALRIDPGLADAHRKKGVFMVALGMEDQGVEELVKAIEIDPDTVNARLLLGQYYLKQENYKESAKVLKEGLKGTSQDALFYNALSVAAFAQGEKQQGADYLQKAIDSNPDFIRPFFTLARYHFINGENEKSEEVLRQLINRPAARRQATMQLGFLLETKGDEQGAVELYQKGADAGWAEAFVALAQIRLKHRDWAGGVKILVRAPVKDKNDLAGQALLAHLYLKMGNPQSAIDVLTGMESIQPGSGYPQIVSLYLDKGQKTQAVNLAERIIREQPDTAYGYILSSNIYLRTGDVASSRKALSQGLEKLPGNSMLRMEMARGLIQLGKPEQALREYRSILKDDPKFSPALFSIAAYHDQRGEIKSALKFYRETLDHSPKYTPALNNLAYLLAENYNKTDEAFTLALQAYRNEPQNPAVLDTLGYVLLKKGETREAIATLEKAYRVGAGDPETGLHLADAYRSARDFKRAKSLLKHLAENEAFQHIDEVENLLAQIEKEQ